MATPDRTRHGAIQDTGNPVLDSTVNLLMNWPTNLNPGVDAIKIVHKAVAELYAQEPNRLNGPRPKSKSLAQMSVEAEEIGQR